MISNKKISKSILSSGKFPLKTLVLAKPGWVTHFVSTGEDLSPISFDIGCTPLSYTLGALGMPGYYFIGILIENKVVFYYDWII